MNTLLFWLIGIFVFGMAVYGLVSSGVINSFGSLIPGFNQEQVEPGIYGQIRYDISNGEVKFYDGNWKAFKEGLEFPTINGILTEEEVKSKFDSYYVGRSRNAEKIYEKNGVIVTALSVASADSFNPEKIGKSLVYSRGAVITNVQEGESTISGQYYINLDRSNKYFNNNGEDVDGPLLPIDREEMLDIAVSWRDSVLSNPLELGGNTFCPVRTDVYYLIVDLTDSEKRECS